MKKTYKSLIAGAALGLVLPMLVVSGPASAATVSGTQTTTFTKTFTFRAYDIARCVKFTVSGYIYYHTQVVTISKTTTYTIVSPTVNAPHLTAAVSGLNTKTGACGSVTTLSKLDMAQHWSGYSCTFNPSISLGAGIPSVSFWPTCGTRTQGVFSSSFGTALSAYSQTGANVTYGSVSRINAKPANPCYAVFVSAQPYLGGTSDIYGTDDGNSDAASSVCLSATWP